MICRLTFTFVLAALLAPFASSQCVWGSFDATRINYSSGAFTGTEHSKLRAIVTANGGTVGPTTRTLTPAYLAKVNVFYTSMLHLSRGVLSAAEQTALQAWVAGGGHLIVTADCMGKAPYDTFTSYLGISYGFIISGGSCRPTSTMHPITCGVIRFGLACGVVVIFPTTAKKLGIFGGGQFVLGVLEATSTRKGRVVVVGDHNLFTNSIIVYGDNRRLATNIAKWICGPGGGCTTRASWNLYGSGLAGTNGIPVVLPSANPVITTTISLRASNSSGRATNGLVVVGLQIANVPFLGGTLLSSQDLLVFTPFPSNWLTMSVLIPDCPSVCGTPVYVQVLQRDVGAVQGVSFTPGLRLIPGS